jgi:hypothetical protein
MINQKFEKFFVDNKVFTTAKASRAGLSRRELRMYRDVISLGTFPVKAHNGNRMENIWTRDARLIELVNKSKKLVGKDMSAVKVIIDEIEALVRDKLGFIESSVISQDKGNG